MPARNRYDKQPSVTVPHVGTGDAVRGWEAVGARLAALLPSRHAVLCVECYPGVERGEIAAALGSALPEALILDPREAMRPQAALDLMLARFLTDDRVFGYMAPFRMDEFFDPERLGTLRARVDEATGAGRPVVLLGVGAAVVRRGDALAYADMPRWELQLRYRRGMPNWTDANPDEDFLRKYKRGFFIEWRTADRHKMAVFETVALFLDTTVPGDPRAATGTAMRAALAATVERPFRVVPFFDPGVWGGQWMRERFELPPDAPNYAWGFDCVPEENSLNLDFGDVRLEVPSINLVLRHPEALLGPAVHARFGAEFPIRFDFLDTVRGGNLSLQVHPTTAYIQQCFGMPYTQDESYYMLEAGPEAAVYLGLKTGVTSETFFEAIEAAQAGGPTLDVDRFVNRWPARKHDHFSIPAGTVHCSGSDCVVLEISATPYIFTFKLWDWGRIGLDGRPRPVHVEHARQVLRQDRDTDWVRETVLSLTHDVASGPGWREESTGLHALEFIETRRHWFDAPVDHDTAGSVHVLNLVEGDSIRVESPDGAFAPMRLGYAETFIVPAGVGRYRIVPGTPGQPHATLRASVRF